MSLITFGIFGLKRHLADVTFKFKEQARKSRPKQSSHIARRIRKPRPCAMFQNDFRDREVRKNVEIKDIQPNVFEHLIRHVYNIDDVAKLLAASDKYGMDSLKEECCSLRLSRTLNVGNAVQNLVLAHLLKAPRCYTI
jgi:speckle-type POZ protein